MTPTTQRLDNTPGVRSTMLCERVINKWSGCPNMAAYYLMQVLFSGIDRRDPKSNWTLTDLPLDPGATQ